jgi:hypothetical protein
VVLEPDPAGVLLSVRAHPEAMETIALHLLRFPFRVEVLAPVALKEALVALGQRALGLGAGVPHYTPQPLG